jgi:hypothetical protein
VKELQVLLCDQAAVDEQLPVDEAFPKVPPHQDDHDAFSLPGLEQRQRFEQFIQGAKASGKRDERLGPNEEVHFPDRKIAKLKIQRW